MTVQVNKMCSFALAMMISGEADNILGSCDVCSGILSSTKYKRLKVDFIGHTI